MEKFVLDSKHKKILSDTFTPVSVYLKIRDVYPNSILLESSDYNHNNKGFSYICFNPIAHFKVEKNFITRKFPDNKIITENINEKTNIPNCIDSFSKQFKVKSNGFKFINSGLFGYISHDAVRYFENISLDNKKQELNIPDIYYAVYQNIIAISLFNHEAHIFSHSLNKEHNLGEIEALLENKSTSVYSFKKSGGKTSNLNDNDFIEYVKKAKAHCHRGDVFQLVLSRRFSQGFKGDEFNVYRSLRSINPSPYLFFFDYGDYKIFGSSPEAQLIIKDGNAEIHPIAGTFRRTGNDEKDKDLAIKLKKDPKENSEHVMLIDLARNDLSRNGSEVSVEKNREIQLFSHVIHLVSKVKCKMKAQAKTFQVVADTFPAGTLSGAPKHKALQLIDKYESIKRNFYGGAIGYMDFEGNFNHAIIIRSFLSKNQELHYQAGAGIVADSNPDSELQEVYNKLGALDKALKLAEELS